MDDDSTSLPPDESSTSSPWWLWLGLILVACTSFWCQATVTEERFVPALNVIATAFGIPDDVAGATLMAAGASSPELFSSIVALFVTHSSLGLGTIVGSEIFNQLIICAGAVWASKSGSLELDPAILTREVGFYALSILLLYLALRDTQPVEGDTEDHIFISFGESCMVFVGYLAYVWVCGNMEATVAFVNRIMTRWTTTRAGTTLIGTTSDRHKEGAYGSIGAPSAYSRRVSMTRISYDIPYLREKECLTQEPVGNFQVQEFSRTISGQRSTHTLISDATDDSEQQEERPSLLDDSLTKSLRTVASLIGGKFSDGFSLRKFQFVVASQRPSDGHAMRDLLVNEVRRRFSWNCCGAFRSLLTQQFDFLANYSV